MRILLRAFTPAPQHSDRFKEVTMSHHVLVFLLVFVGGGFGSILRHAVNLASAAFFGIRYPYGTVFVNIFGSLAMGLIAGWFAFRGEAGQLMKLFLTTGILGGFTTFSAFSLDAALLWERGQIAGTAFYVAGSVLASIVALFAGLAIMRTVLT
jgi:CrcB protein